MDSHVKTLGWLHIVFGSFGVLAGLGIFAFFGSLAALVGITEHTDDKLVAIPILGGLGGIIFIIALIFSLPSLIAGFGLLNYKPWARILSIVLSALDLFHVPFGTALGVYGLWVLLNPQTEAMFQNAPLTYRR